MLAIRDLTDPAAGPHAIQRLVDDAEQALRERWRLPIRRHRANPVVTVADNYDRLGYPTEAAARDSGYSRYVTPELMLRAHTSAMIPAALERLAAEDAPETVLSCPGMVYRRDAIDRQHVGEPHQLDLWRVCPADADGHGAPPGEAELEELIAAVLSAALPSREWRTVPAEHPYTLAGRQVDVRDGDAWVEVGECGLAHPDVLAEGGLPGAVGLASGWGLDRLLMLRKGVPDIRLLRGDDPRIAEQMLDLAPWRPVSDQPAATRDLSIAVGAEVDEELLGDRVRAALGDRARLVESLTVLEETPGGALPEAARERLGLLPGQRNLLVRVVLRDLERTLTAREANVLRDRVYAAVHEGANHQWAAV